MTAALVIVVKQAVAVLHMVGFMIAVLGGVYVPVEFLPGPLSFLGQLFPFAWSLELMREALLDGTTNPPKFGALLLSAILLIPVAIWVLNLALDRARRQGFSWPNTERRALPWDQRRAGDCCHSAVDMPAPLPEMRVGVLVEPRHGMPERAQGS